MGSVARRVLGGFVLHDGLLEKGRGGWKFGASWMRRVGTGGEERNSDMRSVSGTGSMAMWFVWLLASWGWGVVPRELVEASECCSSASEVSVGSLGGV